MPLSSLRLLSISCALVACLVSPAWSWPIRWPAPWTGWWSGWKGDHDARQRNFDTISHIYNITVFPNQLPILEHGAAGVPSGLFNQNVVGRVDPVGEFIGFQDSIEYFFALAPVPQANAASAAITSFQLTEFSSACAGVAASVVYLFCNLVGPGPDNGKQLAPLKQVSDK